MISYIMERQILKSLWRQAILQKKYLYPFKHCEAQTLRYQPYRRHASYGAIQQNTTKSDNISDQINALSKHLEVSVRSWTEPLKFSYVWLRDHCRCNECYNHTTNQRNVDLLSIPQDIRPLNSSIQENTLTVTWKDGHESTYLLDWLKKNTYSEYRKSSLYEPKLWDEHIGQTNEIASVDMNPYLTTDEGVYDVIKSIVDYGVGIITNVPATVAATENVVQQIAHVQHTLFGGMWEFSNQFSHYDTAYTHQALGAHNDNTYFTEAAGLQVFHCLYHDGDGGETLLVDGFRAANDLKQSHPESYKRLAILPIESEYLEPGRHYYSIDSVLKLHPITQTLEQIRFNLYDRAPMRTLPQEELSTLYEDLRLLACKIRDPAGEWWLKLQPGTVLIINNWRVLHGRASYTGLRKMTGCYVGRADFLSKAKTLGII